MMQGRRMIGAAISLCMLTPLMSGNVASAHNKKWKTDLAAESPFPGEVLGSVDSRRKACEKKRRVRLTHKGVTGATTSAGRATTAANGSYSIEPDVDAVAGDIWIVRVLKKVVRKNARHRHICRPDRATTPAADVNTITSSDGSAVLHIPKGAVDDATLAEITVERISDPTDVPLRYRGTVENFGDDPDPDVSEPPVASWSLNPDGVTFADPAHLIVTVDDPSVAGTPVLLSGEVIEPAEVVDVSIDGPSEQGDGQIALTLALDHFSDLSLLPQGELARAEMLVPVEGAQFARDETFAWRARVTLEEGVHEVLDLSAERRQYWGAHIDDGWTLESPDPLDWINATSGEKRIPTQRVHTPTFTIDGEATCDKVGVGAGRWVPIVTSLLEQQLFDINQGDGDSTGAKIDEWRVTAPRNLHVLRLVKCEGLAVPARITQGDFTHQENDGFYFRDSIITVDKSSAWDNVYVGTWPGSVVIISLYAAQDGAIPAIGDGGEDALRGIRDVVMPNVNPDGTFTVDWPAIISGLGADPSKVCGYVARLNLDADRGGALPGFGPDGVLPESSGSNDAQHGSCTDYTVTLEGQIGGLD